MSTVGALVSPLTRWRSGPKLMLQLFFTRSKFHDPRCTLIQQLPRDDRSRPIQDYIYMLVIAADFSPDQWTTVHTLSAITWPMLSFAPVDTIAFGNNMVVSHSCLSIGSIGHAMHIRILRQLATW